MPKLGSFSEFLRTGALGPLTTSCSASNVAELLGTPESGIVGGPECWPLYWRYGDNVEISFCNEPFGKMDWFQIERAQSLSGDCFLASEKLAITLDGFSGDMRASQFVRQLRSSGIACHIDYRVASSGEYLFLMGFEIETRGVSVIYGSSYGDDISNTLLKNCPNRKWDELSAHRQNEIIASIDHLHKIDSIYSHRNDRVLTPVAHSYNTITGADYLALVDLNGERTL